MRRRRIFPVSISKLTHATESAGSHKIGRWEEAVVPRDSVMEYESTPNTLGGRILWDSSSYSIHVVLGSESRLVDKGRADRNKESSPMVSGGTVMRT